MDHLRPAQRATRLSKKNSVSRLRIAAGLAAVVGAASAVVTMASCTADEGVQRRDYGSGTGGGSTTGGFVTSGGNVDPSQPCVDGVKAECHVTVGNNGDILTCMHGERTCVGGTWGPCVGEFSSQMLAPDHAPDEWAPGEYRPLGLSDAGPCQNNPCDPYCQDFEETPGIDAGYQVIPTITTVWNAGSFDDLLDGLPGGFVNKGIKFPCSSALDCQFDSHCMPTGTNGITCEDKGNLYSSCCMAWKPEEYGNCTPDRPDVSVGLACEKPDGTRIIPVCNRGDAPIVPPVRIYIFPGNSTQFPLCDPDKDPGVCFIPAGSPPILPGKCVEVTSCGALLPGNGVRTIQVNGPLVGAGNLPDNPEYFQECSCQNNWSVWKGTNKSPCTPVQIYQANPIVKNLTYQGVCPPGTRVQWQYLTWDTTTPGDSNVLWQARVATTNGGLGAASYFDLGRAKVTPAPDTHLCSMAGPNGCPINLYTTFGGSPAANSEFLELRITMNPTTDMKQGSKVNNWQISYTCPPVQ